MSAVGLERLDHTVQLTHIWINELDDWLGWNNKPRAYHLLRAVLHALRDWLPPNEAADLAAQLPTLLRGAYYEHWRPATRVKHRTKADFLARIEGSFKPDPLAQPSRAVMRYSNCFRGRLLQARSMTYAMRFRESSGTCGQNHTFRLA